MRVTLTAKLTNLWPSFPDRVGIWREKNPRSKDENQKQTQFAHVCSSHVKFLVLPGHYLLTNQFSFIFLYPLRTCLLNELFTLSPSSIVNLAFASKVFLQRAVRGLIPNYSSLPSGGAIVCLFIMATEYVGPKHRAMAGTFTWYFWTGALMLVALLAYLIRDWRKLSMVTSAPGLLLFIFWM